MIQKIWWAHISRLAAMCLTKRPTAWGPNYTRWQFIHKIYPLWIWFWYRKMLFNVKIGLIWADWQTPHLSKMDRIVGPQIHKLAIFFIKWTPFEYRFCAGNCWKIFKLIHSGLIADPPGHSSKRTTVWGPKYLYWLFFHITEPFQFRFCVRNC